MWDQRLSAELELRPVGDKAEIEGKRTVEPAARLVVHSQITNGGDDTLGEIYEVGSMFTMSGAW